MNVTPLQWLGIILIVNGTLAGATTQLTTLFGVSIANDILAVASIGSGIVGGLVTMFGGQSSMIKSVAAMPGVDRINVNAAANPTLASVAVDPNQPKVGAINPDVRKTLLETAKN